VRQSDCVREGEWLVRAYGSSCGANGHTQEFASTGNR
jgi:hypothetical protein